MQVADNIYLLNGAGMDSNVYCIENELLIDAGSGAFLEQMLEQMERYNIDKDRIKKIVLTHEHFDHIGAAKELKDKLGAKIIAHKKAKINEATSLVDQFDGELEVPEVDERLEEGDTVKAGQYKFEVLRTPGHSPGSISLWNANKKILISGDILFLDGFGRADIPGGSDEKRDESLRKIKELDDIEVLLPGHGTPGSKDNIYEHGAIDEILSEID